MSAISSTLPLMWDQFEIESTRLKGASINQSVNTYSLVDTDLSCAKDKTEAGRWENRKIFIETVLQDILQQCPKDEPLVLISFGADRLLTEYIIGKTLIENGFREISFFLVDPSYRFSDEKKSYQKVFQDFRSRIETVYSDTHREPLPKERIRFLSRCQNISKYFPPHANVAVLQSLPPYSEIYKEINEHNLEKKQPEDLLVGSFIVPSSDANAITFIPSQCVKMMESMDATFSHYIPLTTMRSHISGSKFYVDWGCKIDSDGNIHLSFTGEKDYFETLGLPKEKKILLRTGESVQVQEWIPLIQKSIKEMLSQKIEEFQREHPGEKLSQEKISSLLEQTKEIFSKLMPSMHTFFTRDYVLDTIEAKKFLSSHAGHHYRREFSLETEISTGYKITTQNIR